MMNAVIWRPSCSVLRPSEARYKGTLKSYPQKLFDHYKILYMNCCKNLITDHRKLERICIAIAALAVHVPVEDWGGGGIVNWLSDEMKSQPEYISSFLNNQSS